MKRELTEEHEAVEDHAAGIAGEEDADCPVEHRELWSVDGVCGDVCRHGCGRRPWGRVCADNRG